MNAFETQVLNTVKSVTDTPAYFFNGTMFLETEDSEIATRVFSRIVDELGGGVIFGKVGQSETYYDFV